MTNAHLFGLTDDLRDRIKDLEARIKILTTENDRLLLELKQSK